MKRAIAVLALVGCSDAPVPQAPALTSPVVHDPEPLELAMLAVQAIDHARDTDDHTLLESVVAADYAQLACGVLQRFATRAEAAAAIARNRFNFDWRLTASQDRGAVWAVGTFGDRLVLEPRDGQWKIVAGARVMSCSDGNEAEPIAGVAITAEIAVAPHATICAIEHRNPTIQWPIERMFAIDADHDGRPDLEQLDFTRAHVLANDSVAWLTGPPGPGARPFAIAERTGQRWEIVELLWTGPASLFAAICKEEAEQRALINWRVAPKTQARDEDVVATVRGAFEFAKASSALTDETRVQLDLIAARIANDPNGSIDLTGFSMPDEPRPMELAEQRALAVSAHLRDHGIPARRQLIRFSDVAPEDPFLIEDDAERTSAVSFRLRFTQQTQ